MALHVWPESGPIWAISEAFPARRGLGLPQEFDVPPDRNTCPQPHACQLMWLQRKSPPQSGGKLLAVARQHSVPGRPAVPPRQLPLQSLCGTHRGTSVAPSSWPSRWRWTPDTGHMTNCAPLWQYMNSAILDCACYTLATQNREPFARDFTNHIVSVGPRNRFEWRQ